MPKFPSALFLGLVAIALLQMLAPAYSQGPDGTQCYTVTGEAVYVLTGYNHVVTVTNDCGKTVQCEVWTSVDPEPKIPVTVGSGGAKSVTARRGSPASAFTAYGECS